MLSFYRAQLHLFPYQKSLGFSRFFSQPPETCVLKFFSELETLVVPQFFAFK